MSKHKKTKYVDSSEFFGSKPEKEVKEVDSFNPQVTPETGEISIPEESMQTAKDMIPAALQGATLEWLDDAIEAVNPEAADEYRKWVEEARKRSPHATIIAELLTPDAIDLLTMGGGKALKAMNVIGKLQDVKGVAKLMPSKKLDKYRSAGSHMMEEGAKGSAESVATDAVSQLGEGGDYNASRTVGAGVLGGATRGALGLLKPRHRMRAEKLGLNNDMSDMSRRTGGDVLAVDQYTQDTAKMMEDMNIFGSNIHYDRPSRSFIGKGKNSELVIPPSDREIFKRVGLAKEGLRKDIQDVIEKHGDSHIFKKDDFFEDVINIIKTSGIGDKDRKKIVKQVENVFSKTFQNGRRASLAEIHDLRKKIDKATRFSQKKMKPLSEEVYRKLGSSIRNKVRDRLKGTPFEELNDKYSRLSDVSDSLGSKLGMGSNRSSVPAGIASANKGMAALHGAKMIKDKAEGVGSQLSETLNKSRDMMGGSSVQDILNRGTRKVVPSMSREPENTNQPNPNRSYMSPKDRLDLNLTKELQHARLPRSSEKIASDPSLMKLLKYKTAQDAESMAMNRMAKAGIDVSQIPPEEIQSSAEDIYKNWEMAINEFPEELPSMIALRIQETPEHFEKDPYNRIDDTVPASMKPDVSETIRKSGGWNKGKSTHDMIAELDELHSTGKYYG